MTLERPCVAAHIGVLNEAEMIGPCIQHLRRIGVTELVVFDLGSTDGTREILDGMDGSGVRVISFPENGTDGQLMQMAQQSLKDSTADWCVLMDADEFPLPRGGDLAAELGRSGADLVELPRYNVALGTGGELRMSLPPRGPGEYADIDMFVDPTHGARRRIEANPTMCWLRSIPAAKIAVRPERVSRVVRGLHDAHPLPGQTLKRERSRDILVAHAALTDYPRFQRKISSIRATFADYGGEMSKQFAWHWRRWVAMDDAGELGAEYDRSCLSGDELEGLRSAGVIKSVGALFDEQSARSGDNEGPSRGTSIMGKE